MFSDNPAPVTDNREKCSHRDIKQARFIPNNSTLFLAPVSESIENNSNQRRIKKS